jgi:hypothetical protein
MPSVSCYASAAASPPPRPPAAKTRKVTIVVDKVSDILSLPLLEIKVKVENTIAATGIEKLKGVELRGVKVLPRNRILVMVESNKTALLRLVTSL